MIIAFNKPYGVLSQFTPESGSTYLPLSTFTFPAEVYPIGRLDADSEGLLLLTNERHLPSVILDPEAGHRRTYVVQVEGTITNAAIAQLNDGVVIRGYRTQPCVARAIDQPSWISERVPPIRHRASIPTSWIELTLREGKNRQVRRMTAAVGFPTLRLIRSAIGVLLLDDLGVTPGSWRFLNDVERGLLANASGVAHDRERKPQHHRNHTKPHK